MKTKFLVYLFYNCTLRFVGPKRTYFDSIELAKNRIEELRTKTGIMGNMPYKDAQFVIVERVGAYDNKIVAIV